MYAQVARLEALSKEKDSELEKKNSQLESLKTDKIQLEGDVADIRYESEVANRKLSLLQKKVYILTWLSCSYIIVSCYWHTFCCNFIVK